MRRVSSKFLSRLLTDNQKESRFEISQELLANVNCNEDFLKNITTRQGIVLSAVLTVYRHTQNIPTGTCIDRRHQK